MEEHPEKINELADRLEALRIRQGLLAYEIERLAKDVELLKTAPVSGKEKAVEIVPETVVSAPIPAPTRQEDTPRRPSPFRNLTKDLEDVIGTSLINKIGIIAIVFGVGIGVKYAFEHDLISPPVRVLMGYLAGAALLFFSYRLRTDYRAFSAVLLSGALAIMYFASYAARVFYDLFPQELAFALMTLLTVFAVVEALRFDQPVIAHIGLVGAYAVPYLLGGDPDQITFFFIYVAIVNAGILVIAFRRYWKSLYYLAFFFTWLIYGSWQLLEYRPSAQFGEALIFLTIFFGIFYLTLLAYKLIRKEQYQGADVAMLLLNSFIFFGLGYLILEDHEIGQHRLGLFAAGNALLHGGVSWLIFRFPSVDRNLFYFVLGLGLVFATIAVPVQFDGNWVTFLWAGEAVLLFWIGRSRGVWTIEQLSYALFPLAFFSLMDDWSAYGGNNPEAFTPLFNINLFTSLFLSGCLGLGLWLNYDTRYEHPMPERSFPRQVLGSGLVLLFLLTLYAGFVLEISHYMNRLRAQPPYNQDLWRFKEIWILCYTLFFLTLLQVINTIRFRNRPLGIVSALLGMMVLLFLLLTGMYHFSILNYNYLDKTSAGFHNPGYILIRYMSYLFAGGLIWASFHSVRRFVAERTWNILFELLVHLVLFSVVSLELRCWMTVLDADRSIQAGLSILWGIYALTLIGLGIRNSRRYLRIAGMVLVGITLVKVVLVDLADLDTPTKTLVLVTLGALLLVISFLYNKFRKVLFGEAAEKDAPGQG